MHPFDRAAVVGLRLARKASAVFPEGWGDERDLALLSTRDFDVEPAPIEVVWGRKEEHRGFRLRRGQATSPVAPRLPPDSRVMSLEMVEPAAGSDAMCVLMPAWNEHGFDRRRKLSAELAARGIGSVAFDIPLYGSRRVVAPDLQPIRTVANFAVMGWGAVAEALSVIAAMSRDHRIGVAGFSMGGNLAALVAAVSPVETAMAGMAASHSPGPVYLDGILNRAIDWKALGGREQAQSRLRSVLGSASVLEVEPLPHLASAVLVVGDRDGFVPASASQALASHWPGAEVRSVPGAGHATLLWKHSSMLVEAVADSFARLDRRRPR